MIKIKTLRIDPTTIACYYRDVCQSEEIVLQIVFKTNGTITLTCDTEADLNSYLAILDEELLSITKVK